MVLPYKAARWSLAGRRQLGIAEAQGERSGALQREGLGFRV